MEIGKEYMKNQSLKNTNKIFEDIKKKNLIYLIATEITHLRNKSAHILFLFLDFYLFIFTYLCNDNVTHWA